MYKATSKNSVITENTTIIPDGYSQILLKNIGECDCSVNDNIPLPAGDTFSWENDPCIEISENTLVRFTGTESVKKVLVVKMYFKKGNK